jgi:hypothetical protein
VTAREIQWRLAQRYGSPFMARRHLAVVPNISWGMFQWETDLLILHKNLFLSEVEIKISMSDFRADTEKDKFGKYLHRHQEMIRRFFYAAPKKLAMKMVSMTDYGVIGIDEDSSRIEILKRATPNKLARKMKDSECITILRLAALKAWDLAHRWEDKFI